MQLDSHDNMNAVVAAINALEEKGEQLAPLFEEIANLLYVSADEMLEDDGGSWKKLKKSTINRKGHDRKLHESGRLRETLDFNSDHKSATVGTSAVSAKGYAYPAVQQFGTEDGKVPARPFLPLTQDGELQSQAADSILALITEYFEEE